MTVDTHSLIDVLHNDFSENVTYYASFTKQRKHVHTCLLRNYASLKNNRYANLYMKQFQAENIEIYDNNPKSS